MNLRIIGVVFIVALAIGIGLYVLMEDSTAPAPAAPDLFVQPGQGGYGAPDTSGVDASVAILRDDGTTIYIPDPTRLPQPEGYTPEQGYQLGGSDSGAYQILFFTSGAENRILVSLLAEPLGETRQKAEAELRAALMLSDADICALATLEVWTLPSVSETYAGEDLGLSFCPGSVLLP